MVQLNDLFDLVKHEISGETFWLYPERDPTVFEQCIKKKLLCENSSRKVKLCTMSGGEEFVFKPERREKDEYRLTPGQIEPRSGNLTFQEISIGRILSKINYSSGDIELKYEKPVGYKVISKGRDAGRRVAIFDYFSPKLPLFEVFSSELKSALQKKEFKRIEKQGLDWGLHCSAYNNPEKTIRSDYLYFESRLGNTFHPGQISRLVLDGCGIFQNEPLDKESLIYKKEDGGKIVFLTDFERVTNSPENYKERFFKKLYEIVILNAPYSEYNLLELVQNAKTLDDIWNVNSNIHPGQELKESFIYKIYNSVKFKLSGESKLVSKLRKDVLDMKKYCDAVPSRFEEYDSVSHILTLPDDSIYHNS